MSPKIDEKIEKLQDKLRTNPDSIVFARLADYLLESGQVEQAVKICEQGIQKHPYYVTGHFVIGKCYLKKELFDQAKKEFKRVLFFDQKYLAAHSLHAEIVKNLGWENEVEKSYQKIIEIDPLNFEIQRKLGEFQSAKPVMLENQMEDELTFDTLDKEKDILTENTTPIEENFLENQDILEKSIADDLPLTAEPIADDLPLTAEPIADDLPLRAEPIADDLPLRAEPIKDDLPLKEEAFSESEEEKFSSIIDEIFEDDIAIDNGSPQTKVPDLVGLAFSNEEENHVSVDTYDSDPSDDLSDLMGSPDESTQEMGMLSALDEPTEITSKAQPYQPEPANELRVQPDPEQEAVETNLQTQAEPGPQFVQAPEKPAPPKKEEEPFQKEDEDPFKICAPRKKEKIVTPTLGEIYAAQGQYTKAIGVFEILRKKEPDNQAYIEKIEYLKRKIEEAKLQ